MNDQNPQIEQPKPATPIPSVQLNQNSNPVAFQEPSIMSRIFNKFYSNKLVFWPVTIFIAIVLLIIILGLLFGKKGSQITPVIKPSTAPFILPTPNATPGLEVITSSELKINILKTQFEEMDIRQNRLKPPVVNFEIKF